MPALPIFCSNCQKWFPSGIFLEEGAKNISFIGFSIECPRCGNRMPLIDGAYDAVNNTLKIIWSHDLNEKELKKLTKILQKAIESNTPAGEIREIIEREIPQASGLNKFIKDGFNLISILSLIVAFLSWQHPNSPPSEKSTENKERTVYEILNKTTPVLKSKRKIKLGVNDLCPCGSRRKFKKCHGSKQNLKNGFAKD